jgi:hypothetical protein
MIALLLVVYLITSYKLSVPVFYPNRAHSLQLTKPRHKIS